MKLTEKTRKAIGWALIAYIFLHIVLNLNPVEIFFLFAYVKLPAAFAIITSAAMGAGAVFAFQFLKSKKEKDRDPLKSP